MSGSQFKQARHEFIVQSQEEDDPQHDTAPPLGQAPLGQAPEPEDPLTGPAAAQAHFISPSPYPGNGRSSSSNGSTTRRQYSLTDDSKDLDSQVFAREVDDASTSRKTALYTKITVMDPQKRSEVGFLLREPMLCMHSL